MENSNILKLYYLPGILNCSGLTIFIYNNVKIYVLRITEQFLLGKQLLFG